MEKMDIDREVQEMELTFYVAAAVDGLRKETKRNPALSDVVQRVIDEATRVGIRFNNLDVICHMYDMRNNRQLAISHDRCRLTKRRREDYKFIPEMIAERVCDPAVVAARYVTN